MTIQMQEEQKCSSCFLTELQQLAGKGDSMSYVGAPACVADIEDTMSIIDTDKYVVFGGAGCLNKEIARGKVMVPTEAYRDEGTSYHYAPASDW